MIARGKTIRHTSNSLAYAENKLHAFEIDRQYLIGDTPQEIQKEFKLFQDLNTRCDRNTLAFVISPGIEDGKNLTKEDFKSITKDFLQQMKLEDHQYIAYQHMDRNHTHVHLYVNRIDMDGKAYNDSFLSNRASRTAEHIAQQRGLMTAKEAQLLNLKEKSTIKQTVLNANKSVLSQSFNGIDHYASLMKNKGVETLIRRNEAGKIIGVKFKVGKELIKASDVDRSLTANRIEQTLKFIIKKVLSKGLSI